MNPEELAAENRRLKALLRRREEENVGLARQIDSLEQEKRDLKETINRAKDIRPWMRPNFDNVRQMARAALLEVVKAPGGWVVKMGNRIGKKFKCLRDIWLILTREEWNLHDEFLPHENTPAPAPAPAPSPARAPAPPVTCTSKELADVEVLRAQWRMFPSMRPAIEETMRRFGITLAAT